DAVCAEYRKRPVRTKFVPEKAFGKSQRFLVSFAVGDCSLAAVCLFNEKGTVWSFLRPAVQPVPDPVVVVRERLERSHKIGAIGPAGQRNVGREEAHRPQGRALESALLVECTQCPKLNR